MLAVALTALILLVLPVRPDGVAESAPREPAATSAPAGGAAEPAGPGAEPQPRPPARDAEEIGRAARDEAAWTLQRLWVGFLGALPKILVAAATLLVAWVIARLVRAVSAAVLHQWERAQAVSALAAIATWIVAMGVALSVIAGDLRALVGSVGLVGLALSWALQTPIESFTGWLLNSFRGYYRKGDRIAVGEVLGDVYRIDLLTTTVWEIGAPFRPGFVHAEQPTGRLVTFPNSEILTGTIVNLTREFPYAWDELAVAVANESDLRVALEVVGRTARELLGTRMQEPARRYGEILERAGIEFVPAEEPQIYLSSAESWTDVVVRYLVGVRERRLWKSELYLRVSEALRRPEVAEKVLPVYPRRQVQLVDAHGVAAAIPGALGAGAE